MFFNKNNVKTSNKANGCISKGGDSNDDSLKVSGYYTVNAYGPVELFRGLYIKLRDIRTKIPKQIGVKSIKEKLLDLSISCIPIEQKWSEGLPNTVVTQGKNYLLDTFFEGTTYTATWYVGLIGLASYSAIAATDTMASHSGWVEDVEYSETTRPVTDFAAASAGAKALDTAAAFSINGDGTTIKGCFIASNSAKSGTGGYLYSAGLFSGGDKVLANGDTLNVSYTTTLT